MGGQGGAPLGLPPLWGREGVTLTLSWKLHRAENSFLSLSICPVANPQILCMQTVQA